MKLLGIGTDIIECLRIGKMIENHGEAFLRRVYTEREIRHCHARSRAIEHFAGWFAAKEAIMKALGAGRRHGLSWTHIEIRPGQDGRPRAYFCGQAREAVRRLGVRDVILAIAHCRTHATAYAMALGTSDAADAGFDPPSFDPPLP